MATVDDGFLSRWSRRKTAARSGEAEAPEPEAAPDEPALARPDAASPVAEVDEDALSDEELLARYELPDPQTLTLDGEARAFMRPEVPQRLKRLALQRLWRLDPVFANVDGLVEYGEDFTDAATVVKNLATVFRVGEGARPKEPEPKEQGEPETVEAEAVEEPERLVAEEAAAEDLAAEETAEPEPGAPEAAVEAAVEPAAPRPAADSVTPARRPRHMVFALPSGAGAGGHEDG